MSINPMKILQLKGLWDRFIRNHPKLPMFARAVTQNAIREGTVIEIQVTTAEGQQYVSNFKITADDLAAMHEAMEIMESMR